MWSRSKSAFRPTPLLSVSISYRYQWLNKDKKHIRRWDNALHYPKLENFPDHIHIGENEVMPGAPTSIFAVLDEIAKIIGE